MGWGGCRRTKPKSRKPESGGAREGGARFLMRVELVSCSIIPARYSGTR